MNIEQFFSENPNAAIAFSGGVDSAFLLYAGIKYGRKIRAYYVKTEFQPEFEFNDVKRLANELKADLKIMEKEVLSDEDIKKNPSNRCYYCKKKIFSLILEEARKDGFDLILDGTNASDKTEDRPGMKALSELKVRSPLRECGLTKKEIRSLSKEAGLFTWDKPAYACLATRIPAGEEICLEKIKAVEHAEEYLAQKGYTDFRVRSVDLNARIEVSSSQWMKIAEERNEINTELKKCFKTVSLNLEDRCGE